MIRRHRKPVRSVAFALIVMSALAGFGAASAHAATNSVECDTGYGTVAAKPALFNTPARVRKATVKLAGGVTGCTGTVGNVVSGDIKIALKLPTNQCAPLITDSVAGHYPPSTPGTVRIIWRDAKGQKVATSKATTAFVGEDASARNFLVFQFTPVTGPYRSSLMVAAQAPSANPVRTTCAGAGFTGFTANFVGVI